MANNKIKVVANLKHNKVLREDTNSSISTGINISSWNGDEEYELTKAMNYIFDDIIDCCVKSQLNDMASITSTRGLGPECFWFSTTEPNFIISIEIYSPNSQQKPEYVTKFVFPLSYFKRKVREVFSDEIKNLMVSVILQFMNKS